jgi:hypothetical protein
MHYIFIDESGDLGWNFEKENNNGGSSRYLTIGGVVIHSDEMKHLKRLIRDIYKKYNLTPRIEKKGSSFSDSDGAYIIEKIRELINEKTPSLRLISITISKERVRDHLRKDTNILYNYILSALLEDVFKQFKNSESVIMTLDSRTIKVSSGNSFSDYIKTKCWFEWELELNIEVHHDRSDINEGIWVADWISNWTWRSFDQKREDILLRKRSIENTIFKELFFRKYLR